MAEGGDVLCWYIPYSKKFPLILSSLHMHDLCGFISWYDEPTAFQWDGAVALNVPADKEFAKTQPGACGHLVGGHTKAASVSCIFWRLRLPCRSSEERICKVLTNYLVVLTLVKTEGVWTRAE